MTGPVIATLDLEAISAVLAPLADWSAQCHAASLKLVKSGVLPETARVARGSCVGVGGQHSWVCVEGDCYDPKHTVIDPTLWSYDDTDRDEHAELLVLRHRGEDLARRPAADGGVRELRPALPIERSEQVEEVGCGQGDQRVAETDRLAALVGRLPVLPDRASAERDVWPLVGGSDPDRLHIVGMATDLNPQGLYR